jgi:ribosome biogenesis protein NSA2
MPKEKQKYWKLFEQEKENRRHGKECFVGDGLTRKPPKYETFIRPMGLCFKRAHVTHPELKATFCLPILSVKKNPSSPLYTTLGVITKGPVTEVNVSELGLVTQGGKVIWGKYVQVTNHPKKDGVHNCSLAGLTVTSYRSFHSLPHYRRLSRKHDRWELSELPSRLTPCAVIK